MIRCGQRHQYRAPLVTTEPAGCKAIWLRELISTQHHTYSVDKTIVVNFVNNMLYTSEPCDRCFSTVCYPTLPLAKKLSNGVPAGTIHNISRDLRAQYL